MACKYCFGSEADRSGKTADFKVIKGAIDYIAKQKKPVEVVFSAAGEHTLELELLEKTLKSLYEKLNLSRVRISCNGTMSPKTYLRLRDYFDGFQISLDGPPEIQDLQRPMKGGGNVSWPLPGRGCNTSSCAVEVPPRTCRLPPRSSIPRYLPSVSPVGSPNTSEPPCS